MRKFLVWFNVVWLIITSFVHANPASASVAKPKCERLSPLHWTPSLAKAYARFTIQSYGWNKTEWKALNKLWNSESHWRWQAKNKTKERWSGKYAGGIPQLLGMDTSTPAPAQIEQGLAYIKSRYGKPSVAWAHHRAHGWY